MTTTRDWNGVTEWVALRETTDPASAERVAKAGEDAVDRVQKAGIFGARYQRAAAQAAMELQIVVETHADWVTVQRHKLRNQRKYTPLPVPECAAMSQGFEIGFDRPNDALLLWWMTCIGVSIAIFLLGMLILVIAEA